MCSTSAPSTASHERHLPGRERQAAALRDGLLRHRRHAHPGRAIEQNHDERGIIWPAAMAPFAVVICPIGYDRSAEVQAAADRCTTNSRAGHRRAAGRPRRAPRRDVRRLGTDRRAAARGGLRPRPEGRHGGSAGPARRQRHGHAAGRRAACREGPPGRHDAGAPRALPRCRWRWLGRPARAGAQVEEPLADAVRTALSAAVADAAPPKPRFDHIEQTAWPTCAGSARCQREAQARKAEHHTRIEFLETVWYESRRAGLETALVLGLIQVESGFRKYAISSAGARGYMQVMPFWARLIGDGDAGGCSTCRPTCASAA
jgi:hypothetical protein